MACAGRRLAWWDRDLDRTGRPIRPDVRSAGHEIWEQACRRTNVLLGDYEPAAERALRRYAAKVNRLELVGGSDELSNHAEDNAWSRQANARLDLENIVRQLSERNAAVLTLRAAQYEWKEIAQLFGVSAGAIRNAFWREIGRIRCETRST
jgi:DNA-directed RNA polymerase specialized sigma24 family protein